MSSPTCAFLTGLALGAGLMYLFDPQAGRRRRALIGDKAVSWANDAEVYAGKKARHLRNRAQGAMHEAKSLVGSPA